MKTNKINLFSIWLHILGLLVISIIIIGGYTRISDSGLSITEWEPISGILYPLSNQSWLNEFAKYKLTDEFKLINSNMTLYEFKFIYFWEWFHRFFARLIGVIFLIPLSVMILRKQFPKKFTVHVSIIGFLLVTQAIVGWYMVKSGLVNRVDVSHYRLSVHLINAFLILGIIIFTIVSSLDKFYDARIKKSKNILILFSIFLFFQIFYGAFVSGTHSGLLSNTWPNYNGKLIPDNALDLIPVWMNFFENKNFILFFHRSFAFVLLALMLVLNLKMLKNKIQGYSKFLLFILNLSFLLQILLGIFMTYQNIPWYAALAHQGNSIILFTITIFFLSQSLKKLDSI